MSPLEAAREIAAADLMEVSDSASTCPFCSGFPVGRWGDSRPETAVAADGFDHYHECPWLAMPKIVAALEAAERVVARAFHPESDRPGRRGYLSDLKALAAALKGDA